MYFTVKWHSSFTLAIDILWLALTAGSRTWFLFSELSSRCVLLVNDLQNHWVLVEMCWFCWTVLVVHNSKSSTHLHFNAFTIYMLFYFTDGCCSDICSRLYIQVCASMYVIESDGGGLDKEMCKEMSFLNCCQLLQLLKFIELVCFICHWWHWSNALQLGYWR